MAALFNSKRAVSLAAILSVGWAFLWLVPWQSRLGSLPWLGLAIAFVAFIVPGACAYHLLHTGQPLRLSAYLTVGFALSVTWVGFIGLIARIVHLPFLFVYYSLFVAGEIGIILVSLSEERPFSLHWPTLDRSLLRIIVIVLPTIVVVGTVANLSAGPFWGGDKTTYTAFVTNWQHSTSLDFHEVFLGTENVLSVRFWLSLFPMTMALIAKLSGVHGLLLSAIYLRPALTVLASLCVYELARTMGLSAELAALAVVAQLFLLLLLTDELQPGQVFIVRLEEDKVITSYVLAPILIHSIKDYLDQRNWQQFLLLLLAGLSLTFTHPTAMGVACLIGGLFSLFHLLIYRQVKPFLVVGLVLFVILVTPFCLRFFDSATASAYSSNFSIEYQVEENTNFALARANVLEDSRWYGFPPSFFMITAPFDPNIAPTLPMKIVRNSTYCLVMLIIVLAILRLSQRRAVGHYVIAGAMLLLLGVFPYTGWILGIMLTPLHLWRIPWQFPYGIAVAFLVATIQGVLKPDQVSETQASNMVWRFGPIIVVYILAAASLALLPMAAESIGFPSAHRGIEDYSSLAAMGRKLDQLIPEQAVVMDWERNSRSPSLSSRAKAITMRNPTLMSRYGLSQEEAEQRDTAFSIILDSSPAIRILLMQQYQVKYVLFQDDSESQRIRSQMEDYLRLVDTFDGLSLYEFMPDLVTSDYLFSDPAFEALTWLAENAPKGSVIATNVRTAGEFELLAECASMAEGTEPNLQPDNLARSPAILDDLYAFFEDPENEVDILGRLDPDYVVFVRQDNVLGERFAGQQTRIPVLRERLMLKEQIRFGEVIVIYEVVSDG